MSNSYVVKNFLVLTIVQVSSFLIPLIILPYLARTLGIEAFGRYSSIQAVILIGSVITDYGYITSGTRRVAIHQSNKVFMRNLLNTSIVIRLCLGAVVSIFGAVVLNIIISGGLDAGIFLVTTTSILLSSFNLMWVFQGIERMIFFGVLSLFSRLLGLIATILFVNNAGDVQVALWTSALPLLLTAACGLIMMVRIFDWRPQLARLDELLGEAKDGWSYFLPTLYSIFFTNAGIVALGLTRSSAVVGGYSAVERLVKAVASLNSPVNQAVYPRVAAVMNQSRQSGAALVKQYLKVFFPFFVLLTLILILFRVPIISLLYGEEYQIYSNIMLYLPLYVLLSHVNTFLGVVYLTTTGQQKKYSQVFALATLVALAFYFIGSVYYGPYAIAAGLVTGEALILALIVSHLLAENRETYA